MAVPDKVIDTATDKILLPKEISSEIWARTVEESAVMRLARRVTLPSVGEEFQIITKDPSPEWVNEAEEKPVGDIGLDSTSWKGYKLAVILPFSNEFRRDAARLYDAIVERVPRSFGTKIDATVFGDGKGKPGELFDTMADVPEIDVTAGGDLWDCLVKADAAISAADGLADGLAITPLMKSYLLGEKDNNGRPLFVSDMASGRDVPMVMGLPTYVSRGVGLKATQEKGEQLGFMGEWSSAMYGVVEDVTMKLSDQATINVEGTQVNLWQRNMFAVLFEMTVGFKLRDKDRFVKLVGAKEGV